MQSIFSFLSGPVKGLFDGVTGLINTIKGGSPEEKLALQAELAKLQNDFNQKLLDADVSFAQAQRDAIVAEANGHSWLQRNWRPLLMLFFAVIIGTVVWTGGYINGHLLDHDFVMEILGIIKLGIGGYVIGRTTEKVAPSVIQAFKK